MISYSTEGEITYSDNASMAFKKFHQLFKAISFLIIQYL